MTGYKKDQYMTMIIRDIRMRNHAFCMAK